VISHRDSGALARRVWRELLDLTARTAPARIKVLARRGLTLNDSRALFSLNIERGQSTRSLTKQWQCHPTYTTRLVNRLERRRFARRQHVSADRRICLVVLTPKGANIKTELLAEFFQPPADFKRLQRADLQALDRVLAKLGRGLRHRVAAGGSHVGRDRT
jgi:DNA-binding MarR family transcriptional regulator